MHVFKHYLIYFNYHFQIQYYSFCVMFEHYSLMLLDFTVFSTLLFQRHCVEQTKQTQPLQVQNTSPGTLTYNWSDSALEIQSLVFGKSFQTIRHTNLHHLSLCFDCRPTIGHFPPSFWLSSYSGPICQKMFAQHRLYSWK